MRSLAPVLLLAVARALTAGPLTPVTPLHIGPVTLAPSGFLESLLAVRSQTTHDAVSTRFGSLPLRPSRGEAAFSLGHSRIGAGGRWGRFSAYYESDFMQRAPAGPYRIRQFFGRVELGRWELSAGREHSLLRANRKGITSQRDLLNTRVADAAHHTGVTGVRNRQVRAVLHMGAWSAAVSFEDGKNGLLKAAHDSPRLHWETAAVAGTGGHHGGSFAAVWRVTPKLHIVTQQYGGRGAGFDALGTAPAGVHAFSTLEGVEASIRKWLLYSYAGMIYAARSSGNRTVRQITAGFAHELARDPIGSVTLNMQLSRLERAVWSGAAGRQTLFVVSLRHTFGEV